MFDVRKMFEEYAEGTRWAAMAETKMALRMGALAPPFFEAMNECFAILPLTGRSEAGLHTWTGECPYVAYSLAVHEAMGNARRIAHEMVTRGWLFKLEEDAENRRLVYTFTKKDLKGVLFVRVGESEHCKLVEDGEVVVAASVRKKYKIECDKDMLQLTPPA